MEESFNEWIKKNADSIVDEVLKTAKNKQDDGEYQLYNDMGGLVNSYENRDLALQVAKKKHLTIRHVKKQVQQPIEKASYDEKTAQ